MKFTITRAICFLSLCGFVSCSEDETPGRKTQASPAEKSEKSASDSTAVGISYGTLTLKYGDETVEVTTFKEKRGGEVIIPKSGNVQLSLVGTGGEMFSLGYKVEEGGPLTGEFVATKKSQTAFPIGYVTLQNFIGKPLKGLTLREGTITVTKCDLEGNFVAKFEGAGGSLVPPEVPLKAFSGTIKVKVPVKRSGFE